ncbi:MAG: DegT/DnrJ/EryC1/StrS family aminotransferase [Patescibacteria group bacterium]|nr:DegT/DnrJ/EryC1/StrS family aminotransferase [Patescibacteria group bacterium]
MKINLISPDFFPNFEKDDYQLIKKIIKNPKELIEGREIEILEYELKKFFPKGEIFFFTTERGALEFFLKFYLSYYTKNKKVITQAFTCFVVSKAIIKAGGIPLYVDIAPNYLNFDKKELEKVLKENLDISAIILQNTFGVPNNINQILDLLYDKNILIIENLAHSFGGKFENQYLGNFGKVALISFGRSKVISSIFGGVLVINDKNLAEEFRSFYEKLDYPKKNFILRTLIYSLIMGKARENFSSYGKYLLALIRKLNLGVLEISKKERIGETEDYSIKKMPNAFAKIAIHQLKKIFKFNDHREKISKTYIKEGLIPYGENYRNADYYYLRFPLTTLKPPKLIEKLKKYNIYLGNWYNSPLAPLTKRLDRYGYYYGMCPNAENLSLTIYNLPTNILTTIEDAHLLTELIKKI